MLVLRRNTIFSQLAGQLFCHSKDLDLDREGLLKLPIPLTPKVALNLLILFYNTHDKKIKEWAEERGFSIEDSPFLGPQILWLRAGDIWTRDDRVSIVIFIPRPKITKERQENAGTDEEITTGTTTTGTTTTGTTPAGLQEPPFKVVIKSPVSGPVFAESPVECEVGDVVVLEGGEQLRVRADERAASAPSDVCLLCALHRTSTVDIRKKDNGQI